MGVDFELKSIFFGKMLNLKLPNQKSTDTSKTH